jgi:hypothetical protein
MISRLHPGQPPRFGTRPPAEEASSNAEYVQLPSLQTALKCLEPVAVPVDLPPILPDSFHRTPDTVSLPPLQVAPEINAERPPQQAEEGPANSKKRKHADNPNADTQEPISKRSKAMKKRWENPKYKENLSNALEKSRTKRWQDPKAKQKYSEIMRDRFPASFVAVRLREDPALTDDALIEEATDKFPPKTDKRTGKTHPPVNTHQIQKVRRKLNLPENSPEGDTSASLTRDASKVPRLERKRDIQQVVKLIGTRLKEDSTLTVDDLMKVVITKFPPKQDEDKKLHSSVHRRRIQKVMWDKNLLENPFEVEMSTSSSRPAHAENGAHSPELPTRQAEASAPPNLKKRKRADTIQVDWETLMKKWDKAEYRKNKAKAIEEKYEDPAFRETMPVAQKEKWDNPKYRAEQFKSMREDFENRTYRGAMVKAVIEKKKLSVSESVEDGVH